MHTPEPAELDRLILDSVQEANVLPITSVCGCSCIFCSHKNNPPGVAVHRVGVRSLDQITRTLAFLDPGRPITIGESATTIVEGEPLSHPAFREIVGLVRRAFPTTGLEITTNGSHLTADLVDFLEGIGNLTLNVSLNSASIAGRRLLMRESAERATHALEGVRLLGRSGVRFSGSLVALPGLVGWDDVRATVDFLCSNRAQAVRVIAPAFSALADPRLLEETRGLYPQLREFVEGLPDALPCPVLLEPSCVSDLTPVVSGVVADSPAGRAGLRRGDVLARIDGREPRCRVEAWRWLAPAGPVSAEVSRDGARWTTTWVNEREGEAGVAVEYDFDPARMERLGHAIAECGGPSLLLTSELGSEVVRRVLESLGLGKDTAAVLQVPNITFGGTVGAAGLLTVGDYSRAYQEWVAADPARSSTVAQIIVPEESFGRHGSDLMGRHFSELQRRAGLAVLLR
jgi:hypothetical protein